jgi:TPP-dependent pyruvate/acetoin dehydrogenase alpha subunit
MKKNLLLKMHKKMLMIRLFEEKLNSLFLQGKIPGTLHLYNGQEACAVGVCENLSNNDWILSTHRPHGHAIAKGVSINSLMAELFAKETGCCGGFGGSMHVGDIQKGSLPAIAIVGANIPIATGVALSFKMQKKKNIVCCFMGDGAINEGAFHEGINMAAIWKLPVIFVCENNLYGASTKIENMINVKEITERIKAYGIKSTSIDGMNVIEVYKTIQNFSELIKKGQGPFFVECKTYRFVGHSRSDTNKYRLKNEEDFWKKKDPIIFIEKKLLKEKIVDKEYFYKTKNLSHNELNQAVKYAERSPLPKIKDIKRNVYAL